MPLLCTYKTKGTIAFKFQFNHTEPSMKFTLVFIATVLGSALATPVALSPEAAIEV
jgi:hypothetical protein